MSRWMAGLVMCAALSAQTPRDLFVAHCAGCHGPAGEGSRGPSLKKTAIQHTHDVDSLVTLLRRGVPGTEMPAIAPEAIADEPLRGLAGYVLSLRVNDGESAPGRLDRGAELFRGKGKCTDCHRVQGAGSTAGPDLTDIGRLREPDWLRRAVIEPETAIYDSFAGYRWTIAIPDNYLLVDVTTKEGEHVIGSRLNEDAFSIQIRDREGRIRSYDKTEIRNMQKQWGKSPMPSYRDVFSKTDVDDLVAYLASLRGLQ